MYDIEENLTSVRLLESWATTENPLNSTEEILDWIKQKNSLTKVKIDKIPYDYKDGFWFYDENKGEIRNRNNTFFQICGLQEFNNGELVKEQPIIIQKEIGYLGIIGKVIDGVLYFLMQAKIEPGNVNTIQISPTIQATKSNFMRAHGGKAPPYLDYFTNKSNYEIVVDQIQSEQSSRFLGKRNRNIIIIVDDEIELLDSHKWMTLGQIKQLMRYDNLVNMDTRTVISCIPFALHDFSYKEISHVKNLFSNKEFFNSMFFGSSDMSERINRIYRYMNEYKMLDNSDIKLVPLKDLKSWKFENGELYSNKCCFKVVYCDIEIEGREVRKWQQPLLEATGQSTFGLIYCSDKGKLKFLIHAKSEVGCFDRIEIGPSVQLEPFERADATIIDKVFNENLAAFERNQYDDISNTSLQLSGEVKFQGLFSEEGGRFYHEQNQNIIMQINKNDLPNPLPEGYFWVDYQTLNILIQFNNCLNIQLRNLLSILDI